MRFTRFGGEAVTSGEATRNSASSLLPCFGTRLRPQSFNLAPTQYRQLRRLKPPCSKVNNKATMMYFIGSFEYRATFQRPPEVDFLHSWAVVLGQIFRQIVSIRVIACVQTSPISFICTRATKEIGDVCTQAMRVMTLINTNVVASRPIKRELHIFISQTTDFHFVSFRSISFRELQYSC